MGDDRDDFNYIYIFFNLQDSITFNLSYISSFLHNLLKITIIRPKIVPLIKRYLTMAFCQLIHKIIQLSNIHIQQMSINMATTKTILTYPLPFDKMMKSFVIESAQYLLWPILMNSCFSLQQFGPILDVEIIFNERGSKDTEPDIPTSKANYYHTRIAIKWFHDPEVNNATARVQTKKTPTLPNVAALRGVAIQRGRARGGAYTAFAARHPTPLTAAAATALHGYTHVYQDPFLAYATADGYRLPASYAANAAYTAAAARSYAAAAAAAQPMASYAAVAGYGREYADPYLGHSIGPVAGYGAAVYRSGYNRFAPY
ncbi:RNA binding protein fox-1 2 [Nymphon striatum]|nr:RNA binding protein fox-1 2 [Nymphon striatum]